MRNQIGSGHSSRAPHCSSACARDPNCSNSSQRAPSALSFGQSLRQSPQKCVGSRPTASKLLGMPDWCSSRRFSVLSDFLTSL
jgi:hypothetical protein